MAKGGMHGEGGMHGKGACMTKGGMSGEGCVWDMMRYRDTINERVVHILLECILVRNHSEMYCL